MPHDVQQQMGDTHDEVVVFVRPVAGEQVVGDGGGAQAEHRILFGSEVVEEGAGRDSGFRRDVFDGAAAHAVLAGEAQGGFVNIRPGAFTAAFTQACLGANRLRFLHNCNYCISAFFAQLHYAGDAACPASPPQKTKC